MFFWSLGLESFVVTLASPAHPTWLAEMSAEMSCEDLGTGLFQMREVYRPNKGVLKKRVYVVCTSHKAGSQLLRNTMRWIFDSLGATDSCCYEGKGGQLVSQGEELDCRINPSTIRLQNHNDAPHILTLRDETRSKGGFRGVMIIRDPLEMVVSAYCYHHRGAEPTNPIAFGMVSMAPELGVPVMAKRMLSTVRTMVEAYKVAAPDVLVVRYEHMTESSVGFNRTAHEITEFLFGDEITEEQRRKAMDLASHEDLNRGENGFSFVPGAGAATGVSNHTSDDEDLAEARRHLVNLPKELIAEYHEMQKLLLYA